MSIFQRVSIVIVLVVCGTYTHSQQSLLNDEFNCLCNIDDWLNITLVEGWMIPGSVSQPYEHLEEYDISATYPGDLYMKPWTTF